METILNFLDEIRWHIKLNKENYIVGGLTILVLSFIIVLIAQPTSPYTVTGTLVDKQYEGPKSSTGVGTTSDGKFVTTSSSEPEKWFFIIRRSDGEIQSWRVNAERYYHTEYQINQPIVMLCEKGNWVSIINCEN